MNRLAQEKSAYLQQHAANPVHWWAWSEEAFNHAAREKKLVLISIGYSTCHWCHVMEHESFEDADVATLLNERFVCIKVDREEHPDVDQFYMDALHTMVSRGGWPLNMFATPDRAPFFGGTYFPKPQFMVLLNNIATVWETQPEQITEQGKKVLEHLQAERSSGKPALLFASSGGTPVESFRSKYRSWLETVGLTMLRNFDPVWGGFGSAPKFPRSHATSALLRAARLSKDAARRDTLYHAVGHSLRAMAYGGIWDHVGGGFHRYSTDAEWHVPHFEKMLYDQALLVGTYAEYFQVTQDALSRHVVEGILNYVEREMRAEMGAWAAAQDADTEGVEGKFFVWSRDEILSVLGAEAGARFSASYGVSEVGNWEGHNVLRLKLETSADLWIDPDFVAMRKKLLDHRAKRPRPLRDEKVLVSWNGWMAAAFFRAAAVFSAHDEALSRRLLASARKTVDALLSHAPKPEDLAHIYYGTEVFEEALLEDHAALLEALQSAAFSGLLSFEDQQKFLAEARSRIDWVEENFRDPKTRDLLARRYSSSRFGAPWSDLQDEDSATPSSYSTYMGVLARDLMWDSRAELEKQFWKDLELGAAVSERNPVVLTYLLCQLETLSTGVFCKAPRAELLELQRNLSEVGLRHSELMLVGQTSEAFELCELGACFLRTSSAEELFGALAKRFTTQET